MAIFDLSTIRGMDAGGLGEQFRIGQKMIVDDICDNTAEKKKRKLILELEYEGLRQIHGTVVDIAGIRVTGIVKIRVPERKTYPIDCQVKQNGTLVFDPDAQRVAVENEEDQ